jgi:hypothetical protein
MMERVVKIMLIVLVCVLVCFVALAFILDWFPGAPYGFIDKRGEVVIKRLSYGSRMLTHFQDDLSIEWYQNHSGQRIIDKKGNVVVNQYFDDLKPFSGGLAPAKLSSNFGYINKRGEFVIGAKFEDADEFVGDFAAVKLNGKWGFVNKHGELVIPAAYDLVLPFSEDCACVLENGKAGYINRQGSFLIAPTFDSASSFSNGLALVNEDRYIDKTGRTVFVVEQNNTAGYCANKPLSFATTPLSLCSKNGDLETCIRRSTFSHTNGYFCEGLAACLQNGKYGYVDTTGHFVIPPQFDYAYPFRNEMALVFNDEKFGFIDRTGKTIIPPQFSLAMPFSEGLAAVRTKPGTERGKWGYIDTTGEMVIPQRFDSAESFSDGLAQVGDRLPGP